MESNRIIRLQGERFQGERLVENRCKDGKPFPDRPPSIHANIPENVNHLEVDNNPPSLGEVKNTIKHIK